MFCLRVSQILHSGKTRNNSNLGIFRSIGYNRSEKNLLARVFRVRLQHSGVLQSKTRRRVAARKNDDFCTRFMFKYSFKDFARDGEQITINESVGESEKKASRILSGYTLDNMQVYSGKSIGEAAAREKVFRARYVAANVRWLLRAAKTATRFILTARKFSKS